MLPRAVAQRPLNGECLKLGQLLTDHGIDGVRNGGSGTLPGPAGDQAIGRRPKGLATGEMVPVCGRAGSSQPRAVSASTEVSGGTRSSAPDRHVETPLGLPVHLPHGVQGS